MDLGVEGEVEDSLLLKVNECFNDGLLLVECLVGIVRLHSDYDVVCFAHGCVGMG